MPETYTLREVDPKEVAYNTSNPRGEKPEQIRGDPSFAQLIDSVYKFGVLVPVVVNEQPRQKGKKKYRLIDGERRLRAALFTSTPQIPARITTSEGAIEGLTQAFHIHMLRKQWRSTAQTRALKLMIKELRQDNRGIDDKVLFQKLQSLTGYTKTQLIDRLRGSKYSNKILDDVDNGKLAWSYLVQIEESFVEQLDQHFSKLLASHGKYNVRKLLISKAKRRVLTGTRALMYNIVPVINRAKTDDEKKFVEEILDDFISEKDSPAEDVLKKFEKKYPGAHQDVLEIIEATLYTAEKLESLLKSLPVNKVPSYPQKGKELLSKIDSLRELILRKKRALKNILP